MSENIICCLAFLCVLCASVVIFLHPPDSRMHTREWTGTSINTKKNNHRGTENTEKKKINVGKHNLLSCFSLCSLWLFFFTLLTRECTPANGPELRALHDDQNRGCNLAIVLIQLRDHLIDQ